MNIAKKTIADNIEDRNVDNLNCSAFESLGRTTIDYKTFFELVDVYAKGFKELGVNEGDIVTICSAGTLDTVINFFALNKIGAVAQFVNPNYFKFNSKKYINETNSKFFICLDRFYPLIKDALKETNVKRVLLSSISEYSSLLYKVLARKKHISDKDKIDGVEYMDLSTFTKIGENSSIKLERLPYKPERPAVITYTSGTTGNPKGVLHTNDGINSMISIYNDTNGFGLAGDCRNLILIPPMYLTSLVHSIITPLAMGTTNILQPVYNPETLGDDLKEWEPKLVVASKAHYLNLEKSRLPKGSLYKTTSAYCGGEAISKSTAIRIDKVLEYFGIPPMIIGYGQTEFGTMAMFSNYIPDRTNESGMLLPNVKAKIIDQVTGKPVENGKRGLLYISTPAIMKEYINNPEATEEFFSKDEDGTIWGKTGDIAEIKYQHDGKNVYEVSGRASDSFVDENGNVVYLFDIENQVEDIQYVNQAEVVSVTLDDGKKVPIVHVILDKKARRIGEDIIKLIDATLKVNIKNSNAIPYAYKLRDSFATSPISGKRDYAILKYETDDFLKVDENGDIIPITIDSKESKESNDLVKSRIMVKKTTL